MTGARATGAPDLDKLSATLARVVVRVFNGVCLSGPRYSLADCGAEVLAVIVANLDAGMTSGLLSQTRDPSMPRVIAWVARGPDTEPLVGCTCALIDLRAVPLFEADEVEVEPELTTDRSELN